LDRVRSRRLRSLFNIDWQDPLLYDLVINTTHVSTDTAAALVAEGARRIDAQATPESAKVFADLTTTARVQAALITSPRTRNVILNVQTDGGRVKISGILADSELEKEIVEIARKVPGVAAVVTDIEPPPIEYMHP
jgi:osmotically-inducible protein OsmY